MRYDTAIYFQTVVPGDYDTLTGNYMRDSVKEEKRYANVTSSGVDTLNLVYGKLKQGSLTVRIQMPYEKPFDRIRIGKKLYRVDFSRRCKSFVVSEVQQNGINKN